MQDLILVGSGGCMREILWQIEEINLKKPTWNILGFVDKSPSSSYQSLNNYVYLGEDDYLISYENDINVVICVGSSNLRKKIAKKYKRNPKIHFPTIIMNDVKIAPSAKIGQGTVISTKCVISENVVLKDFVLLNIDCMVCHDGFIDDYTTLSPCVHLAGNVSVGKTCNIGMNTTIIQNVSLGDEVVTGAGSVIIRSEQKKCKLVGVPARYLE